MTALFRPINAVGFLRNGGRLGVIRQSWPSQVKRMELSHGFSGAQAGLDGLHGLTEETRGGMMNEAARIGRASYH